MNYSQPHTPEAAFVPLQEREKTQPVYDCSPTRAWTRFFRKYAVFSGRASRSEYWWMRLWLVLLSIAISLISFIFGFVIAAPAVQTALSGIAALALIIPRLALTARRLHDSNHRAWWMLLWIIPQEIGSVFLVIAMFGFLGALFMRFPDLGDYFSEDYDGSIMFQMPAHPTQNRTWWRTLGFTRQQAQAAGIVLLVFLLVGLFLCLTADIIELIFMVLASKTAGVRFDDPRLPMNQTVTYEAFIAWKNGFVPPMQPAQPVPPAQPTQPTAPTTPTPAPQAPQPTEPSAHSSNTSTATSTSTPTPDQDEHPSPDQHK
jgi:uncharacterized membrane protein YhaH (DUF805 family)